MNMKIQQKKKKQKTLKTYLRSIDSDDRRDTGGGGRRWRSAVVMSEKSRFSDRAALDCLSFFVLHKASPRTRRKCDKKSYNGKAKRRIDLHQDNLEEDDDDKHIADSRLQAFCYSWTKIDSTIHDVIRNLNANVFKEIDSWVHKSFAEICSWGISYPEKATCSYPIAPDITSKQLFTGLVLTKNMEFVDDLHTFADLSLHLKSHGCHVARLSSLDFSSKNGISGCLRSLLRQVLLVNIDAADLSILASWYGEQRNSKNPLVVIIDDMDRCCGSVLSEFVLVVSEWVVKIPVILILGIATTLDAPRNVLTSDALQYLCPFQFCLGSPAERLDAIIEAFLLNQCSSFAVGYNVATFLKNSFLRLDGTLTSLIRTLKMAVVQQLFMEPLSFKINGFLNGSDTQCKEPESSIEEWKYKLLGLPSCKGVELTGSKGDICAQVLSELKSSQKSWSTVVLCLFEAGKSQKTTLLNLYCEALNPEVHESRASDPNQCIHSVLIDQTIRLLRELPAAAICQLLERWEKHTEGENKIHKKVKEFQLLMRNGMDKCSKREEADNSMRASVRSHAGVDKGTRELNEKAAELIGSMVSREYMQPIECVPFHEIVCFKNVVKLQSVLIGDPRKRIQADLLESSKLLNCGCCHKNVNNLLPSMHDTSIMYTLAQEHADLINLHDWYQSFRATILQLNSKGRCGLKGSPSPKKRKHINESPSPNDALIQARFCRAVTELQITGLLRMPSKRRPDCVQRVAFGL